MLPDPFDVGRQRLDEEIHGIVETILIAEEDEVETCQPFGYRLTLDLAMDDRREALVERGRECDFATADLGGDRIGTEYEDDCVGPGNEDLNASPPVLERVDLAAIDERIEAVRLQGRLKAVGERHVPPRIGDEDSRPG